MRKPQGLEDCCDLAQQLANCIDDSDDLEEKREFYRAAYALLMKLCDQRERNRR